MSQMLHVLIVQLDDSLSMLPHLCVLFTSFACLEIQWPLKKLFAFIHLLASLTHFISLSIEIYF